MGREIGSTQNNGTPSTFWSLGAVIEDAGDGRLVISSSSTVDDVGNLRSPYLVAAGVYLVVVGLAMTGRSRVIRAFSPEMLSPLGVIFALLVGFVAFQAWNDFDKAKIAV